jgi:regulator of nucleoside diphosphate kinase
MRFVARPAGASDGCASASFFSSPIQEAAAMTIATAVKESHAKPAIVLSAQDYERLSTLAYAASKRMQDVAHELAVEIERARVLTEGEHPPDTVCMNGEVTFRDEKTGKVQQVRLVYPEDADISQRRVSVLTPVGTALIGLQKGHSITWKTPNGEVRQLTVLSVRGPRPA